jgi:hypothetical protein
LRARENYRTPEATVKWELDVAWIAARQAGIIGEEVFFRGDVFLAVRFRVKSKRHGDLSNLLKAIEDALEGKVVKFSRAFDFGGATYRRGDSLVIGRAYGNDKCIKAILAHMAYVEDIKSQGVDIIIVDAGLDGWATLGIELARWSSGAK